MDTELDYLIIGGIEPEASKVQFVLGIRIRITEDATNLQI